MILGIRDRPQEDGSKVFDYNALRYLLNQFASLTLVGENCTYKKMILTILMRSTIKFIGIRLNVFVLKICNAIT